MRKYISIFLCLAMAASILAGCNNYEAPAARDEDHLRVVSTIFPGYDWVREILGNNAQSAELVLLLDNGVDLHSYQPTADDIIKIAACDLFIYVGGESDYWVNDALNASPNPKRRVINLLDALGNSAKTEEIIEGMQEAEHDHQHGSGEIAAESIQDRALSDFNGEWKSLHPYLLNGDLDVFCAHKAEEDGDLSTNKDTYFEKYKAGWACDAEKISVNGTQITFTYSDGRCDSADYTYAGYQVKRTDTGEIKGVRYQFETEDNTAPKYVQFNDHEYEPCKAGHFHIYFGNDGFDALMNDEHNPFFVESSLSVDAILSELMGHGHEEEYDEHVWLSLKNAKTLCVVISDALAELDPENKSVYAANASTYIDSLDALDMEYQKAADSAVRRTLLFGDRFPFRYLVDDYGLDYYAAFAGCSAETEASFETISFLANKLDELSLPCVLTLEDTRHQIAETIVENSAEKDRHILEMDSMQSTTLEDAGHGTTYLSVMERNLSVLKQALG